MSNEVKKINFEGGELLGVRTEDGKVWLGVKKACLDIGLSENQARAEVKKISDNLLFQGGWSDLSVKFDTQIRRIITLEEKFVPMWLAQINLTPNMRKTNPLAVEKLLSYQLKAADALHEAFMATEEATQEFFNELGLKGQIINLEEKVDTLTTTLNTFIDSSTIKI